MVQLNSVGDVTSMENGVFIVILNSNDSPNFERKWFYQNTLTNPEPFCVNESVCEMVIQTIK